LFAAINRGNYADAQDAISRGADLNAQNALGETPLDLAIALNQNSITFMLLSARNEGDAGQPVQTTAITTTTHPTRKLHPIPAKAMASTTTQAPAHAKAATTPTGSDGQPNVSVGFLGFSQK
jgi:ankyrin repeat protein